MRRKKRAGAKREKMKKRTRMKRKSVDGWLYWSRRKEREKGIKPPRGSWWKYNIWCRSGDAGVTPQTVGMTMSTMMTMMTTTTSTGGGGGGGGGVDLPPCAFQLSRSSAVSRYIACVPMRSCTHAFMVPCAHFHCAMCAITSWVLLTRRNHCQRKAGSRWQMFYSWLGGTTAD